MPLTDLDPVIRLVDDVPNVDSSYQTVIIVNAQGKARPYNELKLFDKMLLRSSDKSIYVVGCGGGDKARAICRALDCTVSDFATQLSLDLRIDCEVACLPGKQSLVAERLHGGSGPEASLGDRLRELLDDYIHHGCSGDRGLFIRAFTSHKSALTRWMADRAVELGLAISPRIYLDEEELVRTELIGPMNLEVCTHDSAQRLNIRFEADLSVPDEIFMAAYLGRHQVPAIRQRVPQSVSDYCREKLTLHELHYEVPKVRDGLARYIEQKLLLGQGRKVSRLLLQRQDHADEAPQSLRIEHDIAVVLQPGDSTKVHIRCIAQLTLSDLGKFRACGIADLGKWVQTELDRIVPGVLAHTSYADLCISFADKQKRIEKEMIEAGKAIGYSSVLMFAASDPVIADIRHQFEIQIDGSYETKQSGTKVGVQISVHTRIIDFDKIREHVNRRQDLKALIRDNINQEVDRLIHTVTPDDFYTHFTSASEEGVARNGITDRITQVILHRLVTGFGADAQATHIKVSQTPDEMAEVSQALMGKEQTCKLSVIPSGGGEEVRFEVSFEVHSVSDKGWSTFARKRPTLDQIAKAVADSIQEKLREPDAKARLDTANEANTNKEMKEFLNHWLGQQIGTSHGVVVQINTILRGVSGIEKGLAAVVNVAIAEKVGLLEAIKIDEISQHHRRLQRKQSALKTLEEQYRKAVAAGQMEEARKIEKDIEILEQELDGLRAVAISGLDRGALPSLSSPSRPITGIAQAPALAAGDKDDDGGQK